MATMTRDQALLQAEKTRDLSRLDLSGLDLSDAMLDHVNFRDANLEGVNFRDADLTESEFRDANLSNADFTGAKMYRAVLIGADITNTVFDEAYLVGAFFNGTRAAGARFKRADLRAARMGVPQCRPEDPFTAVTTFADANMAWCLFGAADLTGVDFRGANLSHAHLYEAEIRGALFDEKTNLTGVRLKRQPREYAT